MHAASSKHDRELESAKELANKAHEELMKCEIDRDQCNSEASRAQKQVKNKLSAAQGEVRWISTASPSMLGTYCPRMLPTGAKFERTSQGIAS